MRDAGAAQRARGIALTREVPASIARCELTHLVREPIDLVRARAEHEAYEGALAALGFVVRRMAATPELPDSVFVEDAAVVLDEIAVVTRPGAASRRAEVPTVCESLAGLRPLRSMQAPATLDGGDVLVLEREIVVGLSARTSRAGAEQLGAFVTPFGYRVRTLPVTQCLHLKSAVTRAGVHALAVNPAWVDPAAFPGWEVVEVDPAEPMAANVLYAGGADGGPALAAEGFPRTVERLRRHGLDVRTVPAFELAKAEGGVTCCSLIAR
ncbi:MAG TPA: arginine deiminase family protein [Gemmatimonadaceae bacterium]|nr:arginine deiminase family protein [Gemmatimonadaceae bacterium]